MLTEQELRNRVEQLPLDELVGQVLNYEFNERRHDRAWIEQVIRDTHPGSIYYGDNSGEFSKWIRDLSEKYVRVPMMYVADVEHGPGCGAPDEPFLPVPMAWGAVDDPGLVERAHHETARICRKHMRHLALAP